MLDFQLAILLKTDTFIGVKDLATFKKNTLKEYLWVVVSGVFNTLFSYKTHGKGDI